MNTWDETLAENESDHEAVLLEQCRTCGTILADHYDHKAQWKPCREGSK